MNRYFRENICVSDWYPPAATHLPASAFAAAFLPREADFKSELCKYLEIKDCICGGSGRSLFAMLLKKLSDEYETHRNEVLLPGYTCYSVAASVVRAGLKIRVYDLNPETLLPEISSVQKGVNKRTVAILVQHLFGIPTPLQPLQEAADTVQTYLIEDAAQALGGRQMGKHLGTMADFGFYSFGRGKPLPLGCGGALVGRNHRLLQQIEPPTSGGGYMQLLMSVATQVLSHRWLYGIMEALPLGLGETIFDPGFKIAAMPWMIARLGAGAIKDLDEQSNHRKTIAKVYAQELKNQIVVPMPISKGESPAYNRYPIMAGAAQLSFNLKRYGVRRMYPKALQDEPRIRQFFAEGSMETPGAVRIARELLTLPTHSGISEDLAERISHTIKRAYTC